MEQIEVLIISDMHGWSNLDLGELASVVRLDARVLAGIDKVENIHRQFVERGIVKASNELIRYSAKTVIGLSVRGVIAWRAIQKGMKVEQFVTISSIRLRFEKVKPPCLTQLYFGEKDKFKPCESWFEEMQLPYSINLSAI